MVPFMNLLPPSESGTFPGLCQTDAPHNIKTIPFWLWSFPHKTAASLLLAVLPAQLSDKDRKSTRLNSSHVSISYAVFCLTKKKIIAINLTDTITLVYK